MYTKSYLSDSWGSVSDKPNTYLDSGFVCEWEYYSSSIINQNNTGKRNAVILDTAHLTTGIGKKIDLMMYGIKAFDDAGFGKNITSSIKITSNVDITKDGIYYK